MYLKCYYFLLDIHIAYILDILVVDSPYVRVYPTNKTVNEGETVNFQCQASGDLITGVEWQDSSGRRVATDRRGVLTFTSTR